MANIAFRVNTGQGQGVGHLVRCISLAEALTQVGHQCYFLLSVYEPSIVPFLKDFTHQYLYQGTELKDTELNKLDAVEDAKRTTEAISQIDATWLVVDDYNLDKQWEQLVRSPDVRLLVIDDLCREHHCDALLDVRWRGPDTKDYYQNLVPLKPMCCWGHSMRYWAALIAKLSPQALTADLPFLLALAAAEIAIRAQGLFQR
ncbi:hypothetical protein EXU30_16030 [Shewanella maritima]|uniref:UDP-2,4-diacetamido-2,4, 6-trideoxy-beta-L-altropyranose hydrolase n=1 Tax=Shewanella maritima TaxID=2520507 RepID=A0A411PKG8_9GAMM|nr:hypothetical protein [Shewanella maritima]QBF84012.1 hypothetical protein EXU30_16030 [Shewanella maritima]